MKAANSSPVSPTVLDRPLYSIGEAARLLALPDMTLRRWLEGAKREGKFYKPVIRVEPTGSDAVTWAEFVEARLLSYYRDRNVPLQKMRPFIEVSRAERGVPYPLAHFKPMIENRGLAYRLQQESALHPALSLVRPAEGGQLQWEKPVEEFLEKVEFTGADFVTRLHPLGVDQPVAIDPEVSFGIPQVSGVRTELISESLEAGESVQQTAKSWGLEVGDVVAAARFERTLGLAA